MGRRTITLQLFHSPEIAKPTGVPHFPNLLHAVYVPTCNLVMFVTLFNWEFPLAEKHMIVLNIV